MVWTGALQIIASRGSVGIKADKGVFGGFPAGMKFWMSKAIGDEGTSFFWTADEAGLADLQDVILPNFPKIHFGVDGVSDLIESNTAFEILRASRSSLLLNMNSWLVFHLYLML